MRGAFAAAAYGVLGRGFGFAQTAGMPGRPHSPPVAMRRVE
jgi:hypothetical protein